MKKIIIEVLGSEDSIKKLVKELNNSDIQKELDTDCISSDEYGRLGETLWRSKDNIYLSLASAVKDKDIVFSAELIEK